MGTNNFLAELSDGIMYQHSVLQLLKEVLCIQTTNAVVLGFFGAILLRKSLLGRQGTECIDTLSAGKAVLRCASCGTAEGNEISLKQCNGCDLVRYCSDTCQELHRPEHEAKCKERAAELRDDVLFSQPESSHEGDCPICCLPVPLDPKLSTMYSCCSKVVCVGCEFANELRQEREDLEKACPFCRHPEPKSQKEFTKNLMKRALANDTYALWQMGLRHYSEGDYDGAIKYLIKAAELGSVEAHADLGDCYSEGKGVEKDEVKALYYWEEAAIQGHPEARYNLAFHEWDNDRDDRAVKHWIIAACLGHDESLQELKDCYKDGDVSKDDFAMALRGHYAAVAATKSPQREFGEKMASIYEDAGSSERQPPGKVPSNRH